MSSEYYTNDEIADMYLDYFNNFISIIRFSNYYGLSEEDGNLVIEEGRKIVLRRVTRKHEDIPYQTDIKILKKFSVGEKK